MTTITTPVGRLVYGHPSKLIQKRDNKKQLMVKADGKPLMIRSFGVAFPKAEFNATLWPVFYAEASAVYKGGQPPQHFAYKFKDGDGIDREGKPYNTREGYAGCFVVHFETQFDITALRPSKTQPGVWDQITETDYKTGDYIAVNVEVNGNKPDDPTHTPGLFLNPRGVLHIGDGPEIKNQNAPTAQEMFGGQQFALPPGALPPGSAPQMPQGMATPPGMAPPTGQPPQYAPQPQPPQYAPQYAPAHDFVQQAVPGYQPQQPGQPPAPPQYGQQPGGQPIPGQMPPGFPPR